jgi:hypothetical protein
LEEGGEVWGRDSMGVVEMGERQRKKKLEVASFGVMVSHHSFLARESSLN